MNAHIESVTTCFSIKTNGHPENKTKINSGEVTLERQILEAFRSIESVNFVREGLLMKANIFFPNHVQEAKDMVDNLFDLIAINARMKHTTENGHLKDSFKNIHSEILAENNWFANAYDLYRKERANKDFKLIEPYIKRGEEGNILDFGCGMGHLSKKLSEEGLVVTSADVIDDENRVSKEDKNVKFEHMSSPADINFTGAHFDTIIIWQVLHHINEKDLYPILKRLSKIGDRLIVNEDMYGSGDNVKGLSQSIREQKQFVRYMALEEKDQIAILRIIDYVANFFIRLSTHEMNIPLRFQTVDQWASVLSETGFDIEDIYSIGIREHKWHPDPQVLFVANSNKNNS